MTYTLASESKKKLATQLFADFLKPRPKTGLLADFDFARSLLAQEAKASGLTQETLDTILMEPNLRPKHWDHREIADHFEKSLRAHCI